MAFLCYLNVISMFLYVIRMHLYVTRILLVFTCMSFVCHSYILVCHLYAICMSLVCMGLWLLSTCISSVCHSYVVLLRNQIKYSLIRKCFSLASLELIHVKSSTFKVCANISEVQSVIKWLAYGIILYRKKVI